MKTGSCTLSVFGCNWISGFGWNYFSYIWASRAAHAEYWTGYWCHLMWFPRNRTCHRFPNTEQGSGAGHLGVFGFNWTSCLVKIISLHLDLSGSARLILNWILVPLKALCQENDKSVIEKGGFAVTLTIAAHSQLCWTLQISLIFIKMIPGITQSLVSFYD